MKVCFKCHKPKPISEFYVHPRMADGHLGKCKECTKRDVKPKSRADREARSTYEKKRNADPKRKAAKRKYHKLHNLRHPQKYKARQAVGNAVRDGRLEKSPCVFCGSTKRVEGHHPDHDKPLVVIWSCFKCHREREHNQVVVSKRWN